MIEVLTDDWFKCYGQAWGNLCVPAAVAHPAKFSRKLIFRIFEHAIEEGWVKPGDTCIDCFGGVGLGALPAMMNGLHWVGVELEPRFVLLGQGGDCDGTVEIETRLIHIKAKPSCKNWFVRLRAEAKYWGKSCKVCDGGPIGEGFETKQRASAFADELATSKDRWERMAYTIHYYEDEPIAAHDEWQQFVTRPALCGRQEAHEPHHVVGNIELWNKRYAEQMPNWGSAVIVQGDSRRLGEVLERASLCLSSPPYANQAITGKRCFKNRFNERPLAKEVKAADVGYGKTPGNLGNLPDTGFEAALALGSPPYSPHGIGHDAGHPRLDTTEDGRREDDGCGRRPAYGSEPGQLAQMPEGDLALALGSPPYVGSLGDGKSGIDWSKQADRETAHPHGWDGDGYGAEPGQLAALPEGDHAEACERPVIAISSPPYVDQATKGARENRAANLEKAGIDSKKWLGTRRCTQGRSKGYGSEEGQLGQMPTGSHAQALEAGAVTERAELCLSSPPWEATNACEDPNYHEDRATPGGPLHGDYGNTAGQLGQETGSTFWAASREILEQVYQVLAPGGHAIWVVKMFVRNKQLVDFPGQWEALCQSVGFRTVCKHRAWLNKNAGVVQVDFDGEEVSMEKWFKSFFRRLCESKGSPRIDWELVLCMEKPIN